jgi:hypothetical protein
MNNIPVPAGATHIGPWALDNGRTRSFSGPPALSTGCRLTSTCAVSSTSAAGCGDTSGSAPSA